MMHRAWSIIIEVPYCFSRSYIKFQGHTALKIVEFDPNWAFPDCNSSLNSPMAMKCCTKLETAKERCPIVFQGHPSNFKVTRYNISPILTQKWAFPDYRPVAAFKSLRFALLCVLNPFILDAGWAATEYTFRLELAKDDRVVYYNQIIYMVAGFVPDISIRWGYRESIMGSRVEWSSPEWVWIPEITSNSEWFLWNYKLTRVNSVPHGCPWSIPFLPQCFSCGNFTNTLEPNGRKSRSGAGNNSWVWKKNLPLTDRNL